MLFGTFLTKLTNLISLICVGLYLTDRTTFVHKKQSFQEHDDDGFGDHESLGMESDSLFSYRNFSPKRSP